MRKRSSLSERLYLIINIIMIIIYASVGTFLFFWQTNSIQPSSRKIFSGVLMLYAAYRGFSLFRKIKSTADEN